MGGLRKLHTEKIRYRRNELRFAGYEFLVAMLMEVKGFWAVTPCRLVCSFRLSEDLDHSAYSLLFMDLFHPEKGSSSLSETSQLLDIVPLETGMFRLQFCTRSVTVLDFSILFFFALYSPVVTICTAQWSLYVPHSCHYIYRTVVTICTAQWSLYVLHSGHYMYRTVVTVCTAQWSLYVRPV